MSCGWSKKWHNATKHSSFFHLQAGTSRRLSYYWPYPPRWPCSYSTCTTGRASGGASRPGFEPSSWSGWPVYCASGQRWSKTSVRGSRSGASLLRYLPQPSGGWCVLTWIRTLVFFGRVADLALEAQSHSGAGLTQTNGTCHQNPHSTRMRKRKQKVPIDVNESVHTAHKRHQRNCWRICVLASCVDWASFSPFCGSWG